MQSKHNKSRSLKSKIIASAIAAILVVSSAVPAITTGLGSANAASVDDEATGATDVTTIGNTQDNIVWTNATYFDYLTDDEKSGGYLFTARWFYGPQAVYWSSAPFFIWLPNGIILKPLATSLSETKY